MAGLLRQGHFLGTKLPSLRKRNGLTLEELSARCVQPDAAAAPSVSYLSLIETGKRTPAPETLALLAGGFGQAGAAAARALRGTGHGTGQPPATGAGGAAALRAGLFHRSPAAAQRRWSGPAARGDLGPRSRERGRTGRRARHGRAGCALRLARF